MATKKRGASKRHTNGKVEKVMHEYKHGQLRSSTGAKVKTRQQAIAIGLSEAREAGEDVAPRPKKASKRRSSKGGRRTSGATTRQAARRSSSASR